MAENAVHLSSTEHTKPTIFELWAQDSLMGTLKPAFKIICEVLGGKNLPSYSWLLKWNEEMFLVLNLFLQYQYLCKYNASFSEAFYGLKRIPLGGTGESLKLKHKIKSLITVVLTPYCVSKLKSYFTALQIQNRSNEIENNSHKVKNHFQLVLKTLFTLFNCIKFYYYVSYMAGYSRNHSILDKFSGVEITHNVEQPVSWKEIYQNLTAANPKKISLFLPILIKLASQTIEFGAFFIQFLNWWQTNNINHSLGSLPIPPPPAQSRPFDNDLCPLCLKERKAEVVLQPSGIVFCYPCIKSYLEDNSHCPVTNLPASSNDLIRLYVE